MKKNIIVITGGAGFVGSNLIETLLKNTKFSIISIDDYSSGTVKNHFKRSNRLKYIKGDTKNIEIILKKKERKINSIFHFGEFSRIYQSFKYFDKCFESNVIGSKEVFKFCQKNKIKLIYSATSASLGNKGNDKNLSPYAFTKSKNLELLENLKKWFGLKYEVIYFYNVYGPKQIGEGEMATVVGIFEKQFKQKKYLTVVKPGFQTRRFTHIKDTIRACYTAWKKNKCRHYCVYSKKQYSIIQIAKLFKSKIRYLPKRKGERYASSLVRMNLSNNIYKIYGKIDIKDYIKSIIKNN